MKMSPALSLYLTKFLSGADPNKFTSGWNDVLGESPVRSAKRLELEGLIVKAGLFDTLNALLTLADLKKLLAERGQKQTGNKAALVARFIDCDLKWANALTKGANIFICTALGNEIAQETKSVLAREKMEAEQKTLDYLYHGNYIAASKTVSHYEANQVFPRGMGIDWKNYNHQKQAKQLETIFIKTPQLLSDVKDDIYPARIIAGMLYLWGKSDYTLPGSALEGPQQTIAYRLETKVVARMLLFYAQHLQSIDEYRKSGVVKRVKILSANDQRTCDSCRSLNGKIYSLENVLELPHKDCSSLDGCRCTFLPVIN